MRLLLLLIIMGFFSTLFGCGQGGGDGRFKTDEAYVQTRVQQLAATPQTVAELRKYGVTDQSRLKLEHFFYTNTEGKAAALAQSLAGLGYFGRYDHSASDKKQFVVMGWTSPMKRDDRTAIVLLRVEQPR